MNRALLLAAGKSTRFGADKLLMKLGEKSVFEHALFLLVEAPQIDEIYIAANKKSLSYIKKIAENLKKIKIVTIGGKTRYETVKKLVKILPVPTEKDLLIIHNAANPTATTKELLLCISKCQKNVSGVAPARNVTGTLKKIGKNGNVIQTIKRENIVTLETPQVVNAMAFLKATRATSTADFTDDLAVLEAAGYQTKVIPASPSNRKITTQDDLIFFEKGRWGIGEDGHPWGIGDRGRGMVKRNAEYEMQGDKSPEMQNTIQLGGVKIPCIKKLEAESDGDVALHALCNALSSAIGEGSLGTFATPLYKKGIRDSKKYISVVMGGISKKNLMVKNCSISIITVEPKIEPHILKMKKIIAHLLHIKPDAIGITATTNSGLGKAEKGISCTAIVHLTRAL